MISIEEICGLPEYVETLEDRQRKSKNLAEEEMKYFDLLPDEIREILNYSEIPFSARSAVAIYNNCDYDINTTCYRLKGLINDYKRRNFKPI